MLRPPPLRATALEPEPQRVSEATLTFSSGRRPQRGQAASHLILALPSKMVVNKVL